MGEVSRHTEAARIRIDDKAVAAGGAGSLQTQVHVVWDSCQALPRSTLQNSKLEEQAIWLQFPPRPP